MVLQSPYIKKFYINLPDKYRDKEPYKKKDIKYLEGIDKRVKVVRIGKDIGPISKILSTLTSIKDKNAIIMSCLLPARFDQRADLRMCTLPQTGSRWSRV